MAMAMAMAQLLTILVLGAGAFVLAYSVFMLRADPQKHRVQALSKTVEIEQLAAAAAAIGGGSHYNLYNKVKVLCWILTMPANHRTKAKAVKETWASKCNKAIFMSSIVDSSIPTINLKLSGEGRERLWEKSRKSWYYVFQHFADDYDWFMKADDDSFVIAENLRYFCSQYDPNKSHYFGRVFAPKAIPVAYASGGAGYVISRAALKKLGPLLASGEGCAQGVMNVEDAKFAACMKVIGVIIGDSRDKGADRFHPFVPEHHAIKGLAQLDGTWYRSYNKYPATEGLDCCSRLSISFHYITPVLMRSLYFYLYHLHLYGEWKQDDWLPPPIFVRSKAKPETGAHPADMVSTARNDRAAK